MNKAIELIKKFEGCKLTAYADPASELGRALFKGVSGAALTGLKGAPYTIGYGSTQGVIKGLVWTQDQAESALLKHVTEVVESILKISPTLSGNRLDAVTSFVYNLGIGSYKSSTLCKLISKNNWKDAAEQFVLWDMAGGEVMTGLLRRRNCERDLFMSQE